MKRDEMSQTDYDQYRDRYRRDLDSALSFSGASHDFFTRAKAEELLRLARLHLGDSGQLDALDVGCGIGLTDRHLAGRSLADRDRRLAWRARDGHWARTPASPTSWRSANGCRSATAKSTWPSRSASCRYVPPRSDLGSSPSCHG